MGDIVGISRRSYPSETDYDGDLPTVVVLVAGYNNDYACYIGHGTPEWVARHGDKLTFEQACQHFPGDQLKPEKYRL